MIRRILQFLAIGTLAVTASAQNATELEAVVTTSFGTFRFEFFPDKAPRHVEQFIRLAQEGYYDGSAFHLAFLNGAIRVGIRC